MITVGFIGKQKKLFQEFQDNTPEDVRMVMIDDLRSEMLGIDYVIVRATTSIKSDIERFVRRNPHINFLDNRERFFSSLGKKDSSLDRMEKGIGAATFLTVDENTSFPIVAKPIFGRKEQGIAYLNSYFEYQTWKEEIDLTTYIFQEKLDIRAEYRALVLNINGVFEMYLRRKVRAAGTVQRKLKPSQANIDKIREFIVEHRPEKIGIIGYDVAILRDGSIKFIEENRTPMFDITQKKYQMSLPARILEIIAETH